MYDQVDKWFDGDWVLLGTHIPHWAITIAGVTLVALLVAWLERPKRTPSHFSSRSHSSGHPAAADPRDRRVA
jgi:hypothetical protein